MNIKFNNQMSNDNLLIKDVNLFLTDDGENLHLYLSTFLDEDYYSIIDISNNIYIGQFEGSETLNFNINSWGETLLAVNNDISIEISF